MTSRVLLISPRTGDVQPDMDLDAVAEALEKALRRDTSLTVAHERIAKLGDIERVVRLHRPDVVWNACETVEDRSDSEPLVPAELERLGVSFTGSTSMCLFRCLNKTEASRVMREAGVAVPATHARHVPASAYPVIVKPEREDGSIGIGASSVARNDVELAQALAALDAERMPAIVQGYVEGREIAVALLGFPTFEVLSPGEILYDPRVFSDRPRILTYASKWDPNSVDYGSTQSVEAELTEDQRQALGRAAIAAAQALGMRDYGRVDFRVDASGTPYAIDANPNCDVSEDGGFMRAAKRAGLSLTDTVLRILSGAQRRAGAQERAS